MFSGKDDSITITAIEIRRITGRHLKKLEDMFIEGKKRTCKGRA